MDDGSGVVRLEGSKVKVSNGSASHSDFLLSLSWLSVSDHVPSSILSSPCTFAATKRFFLFVSSTHLLLLPSWLSFCFSLSLFFYFTWHLILFVVHFVFSWHYNWGSKVNRKRATTERAFSPDMLIKNSCFHRTWVDVGHTCIARSVWYLYT